MNEVFILVTEENVLCTPTSRETYERVSHAIPTLPPGFPAPLLFPEGLSSIETLLTNIQVHPVPRRHTDEALLRKACKNVFDVIVDSLSFRSDRLENESFTFCSLHSVHLIFLE